MTKKKKIILGFLVFAIAMILVLIPKQSREKMCRLSDFKICIGIEVFPQDGGITIYGHPF